MQTTAASQSTNKARSRNFTPPNDVIVSIPGLMPSNYATELDLARIALARAEHMLRGQEERIRQLEGLALTDELTGAFNRRGFMVTMRRELSVARRDLSAAGALVMIDLDDFKSINDVWGHNAGDGYLKMASDALLANIRPNDYVARLGGDEFAVVMTRIGEEDASLRAQQIEANFNSLVADCNGFAIPLRGSFGMSLYDGSASPEEVMAEADMKLYEQKEIRRKR